MADGGAGGPAAGTAGVVSGSHHDHLFKIVLVGDSGVGKSNLLSRFTRNTFSQEEKSTIGVEFATRVVQMEDGKRVKAQIWDTAGQERYRAITTAYYRGALGAMLVYDVTKKPSFDNVPRWLREMRDHANRDIALMLVGNKTDLCPATPREVTTEEGRQMAEEFGIQFVETSALSGTNVDSAFVRVVKAVYDSAFMQRRADEAPRPLYAGNNVVTVSDDADADGAGEKRKCCK